MKRILLFLSMLLLVGGTTMAFANGANGSDLTRVSNNENSASATDVVQPQNSNSSVKPLETTNNEPVITFTTSKKIGEKIMLRGGQYGSDPLSKSIKIEGATLVDGSSTSYVLTAQTVKIIGNCTSLDCLENGITSIDLSKNSDLTALDCRFNKLTTLDLSNNSELTELNCSSNELTVLDLSKNSLLTNLNCTFNKLTALDLSNNSLLTDLNCTSNKLTALDLSNNSKLTSLSCPDNQLTSLVLPQNSPMTSLNCEWNKLTELDLSKQIKLGWLRCNRNALTSLDLTKCENIVRIYCKENKIAQIKLPEDAGYLLEIQCNYNNIDLEHMEQFINSLPERSAYRYSGSGYSVALQSSSPDDGNQITAEQERKARIKGWHVSAYRYTTPTGISTIDNADASPRKVYDLNGCEVNENQAKGVVIVKQGNKTYKKVVK